MPGKKLYTTNLARLEEQTDISFFRGSGPGGQNRNKVETGVRLFHRPSGVTVQASERSSQAQNRQQAFARLQDRLAELNKPEKPRVSTRVPKSQKKKRLESKRIESARKEHRKPPSPEA